MSISRVMALGASLVCSVEKTRWPGERGADGDVGGLAVADFADHDHVRILAHDVPQAAANVRPICGFTWIWLIPSIWYSTGSSMVMIFLSGQIDALERRIERGRFAAAGRAR